MVENKNQQTPKHDVWQKDGNKLSIDGVEDVISFDESQVTLVTVSGEIIVDGNSLHVSTLDLVSGRVELDGEIEGVFYPNLKSSQKTKNGFFSRLFK